MGIQVTLEPSYRYTGQLTMPDGSKRYFRNNHFDLNGHGASEIAQDKDYAFYYMNSIGYPVPHWRAFFSDSWRHSISNSRGIDDAYACACQITLPVVVLPNRPSIWPPTTWQLATPSTYGLDTPIVYTKRDFYRAMRTALREAQDRIAVVQQFSAGVTYRIVVFDSDVIAAYRSLPLVITGDGRSTIEQLLRTHEETQRLSGCRVSILIAHSHITAQLKRLRLTLGTVPLAGTRVTVSPNPKLSAGADVEDVNDSLHDGYRTLVARLARDMGLRYCALDIRTEGLITGPPVHYRIVGVNPAPSLDHYAETGHKQRAQMEALYEKILRAILALSQ